MSMIHLPDRAVLRLSGEDMRPWLANLVTCDVAGLGQLDSRWGALLTPQGKILFDFLVVSIDDGNLYLDVDAGKAAELAKRLVFYRLRAKVKIEDLSAEGWTVQASLSPEGISGLPAFVDPRSSRLGTRAIGPNDAGMSEAGFADYHAQRIALGIPEGGKDFGFGEAFPHEVLMDMLGGVDFRKGCYVGQEVVSRMQHRGTARTRIVPVTGREVLPPFGTEVRIGDKAAGTMGSSSGPRGLAMLRLDRVEDGLNAGAELATQSISLTLQKPQWWTAAWPANAAASIVSEG